MVKLYLNLLLVFVLCLSNDVLATQEVEGLIDEPDEFNYSSMVYFVVSDGHRNAYVGDPYEWPTPVMGAMIFGVILKYANSFFEANMPPGEIRYYIHLLGPGQHREIRVHEGWLSYEKVTVKSQCRTYISL